MKNISTLLALALSLTLAPASYAHPEHDDAPPVVYKVDALKRDNGALFHVTLNGEKVATAKATGKLVLIKGKDRTEHALRPSGDNGMETEKPVKMVAGATARALITLPDSTMASTEFIVK
ncbi:MAG: hypothetical protein V4723_01265 [Pseudomonadota bacterium]